MHIKCNFWVVNKECMYYLRRARLKFMWLASENEAMRVNSTRLSLYRGPTFFTTFPKAFCIRSNNVCSVCVALGSVSSIHFLFSISFLSSTCSSRSFFLSPFAVHLFIYRLPLIITSPLNITIRHYVHDFSNARTVLRARYPSTYTEACTNAAKTTAKWANEW